MTNGACGVLFAAVLSTTLAGQGEPVLVSAHIPNYPPLARQARIEGVVKLTFTLEAHASGPTEVKVVSGHAALKGAAVENVKTWHFQNPYAEGKYETEFDYRLPCSGQKVTFESFKRVEILSCPPMHSD